MSEEIFDVVNDRNEVIGQETRSVVHARGLKHRAVHVLVFRKNGDLFIQKRSMAKDADPGRWDTSAAGHLDAGEGYMEAARREVKEELGVDCPDSLTFLFFYSYPRSYVLWPTFAHQFSKNGGSRKH